MQEQNAEYRSCKRVAYRKYACAFRGYVFLPERLDGKANAAADNGESQHCAPFGAALRHADVFEDESADEAEDGYEEQLVYGDHHEIIVLCGNISHYD